MDKEEEDEKIRRKDAYENLVKFVRKTIIEEGNFVCISEISELYVKLQQESNLEVKGEINKNIKQRLIKTFGDSLSFCAVNNRSSEIVYSTSASRDITRNLFKTEKDIIRDTTNIIKSKVKEMDSLSTSCPASANEIRNKFVKIPHELELFLQTLFGDSAKGDLLVQSIEQDLIYNSTNGRKKTVKHAQLGILIRKTGSKYLIETLNRLGHCTSYKTNVIETHFRETHIANRNEVYIPKGIISSNHVRFIYNK